MLDGMAADHRYVRSMGCTHRFAPVYALALPNLEVERDGSGDRPRRYIMRTAEGREIVVERHFVGQVDHRNTSAPLISFTVEEIVVADGEVKQVA